MVHFTNRNLAALRLKYKLTNPKSISLAHSDSCSEFSTIDTTELVLGALFAANYFGGEVENLALQLRDATQWSDALK